MTENPPNTIPWVHGVDHSWAYTGWDVVPPCPDYSTPVTPVGTRDEALASTAWTCPNPCHDSFKLAWKRP